MSHAQGAGKMMMLHIYANWSIELVWMFQKHFSFPFLIFIFILQSSSSSHGASRRMGEEDDASLLYDELQ